MFTGKIYECCKQYMDRYLFGFDHDSLDMSILKGKHAASSPVAGHINLKRVNVRPDEVNKVLDGLQLPLSLKVGMIGNLQIKVSAPAFTITR